MLKMTVRNKYLYRIISNIVKFKFFDISKFLKCLYEMLSFSCNKLIKHL